MKLYLIHYHNCSWDEYGKRYVVANNEKRAREFFITTFKKDGVFINKITFLADEAANQLAIDGLF